MLLLGCIVVILAGKGNGASVLDLARPFVLVGHAVDIDLAAGIGQVEAAIVSVEAADLSGELVVFVFVGRCDELGNGLGFGVLVVISTALAFLEGKDIGIHDLVLLGLLVVEILASEGHGTAVLDLAGPFVLVGYAVDIDGSAVIGQVEAAVGSVEGTYLTGEFVVLGSVGSCDELSHGLCLSVLVVISAALAFGLAVEGIDVAGTALYRLRSVALIVDHLSADDHFVANLHVRIAGSPLLVTEIKGLEAIEPVIKVVAAVSGNVEVSVAICTAGLESHLDLAYDTLDPDHGRTLLVGREGLDIGHYAGWVVRIGLCAASGRFVGGVLALVARLGDSDGLVVEVGAYSDGSGTVVTRILERSHRYGSVLLGSTAISRVDSKPVCVSLHGPVTVGLDGECLRAARLVNRNLSRIDRK